MEKERVDKFNLCAAVGFLLTLLNIVVSSAFLITGSTNYLLIFASVTAAVSLILSICGLGVSKKTGRGKILCVLGIVFSALILAAIAVFIAFVIILFRSCSEVQI